MNNNDSALINLKRIYEAPHPEDGVRILVDRLWPRGVSKQQAAVDEWMKEIAPSPELRKWYGHDPSKFAEFKEHYIKELEHDPVRAGLAASIRQTAADSRVTLLYAAKDEKLSHALILWNWLLAAR